MLTSSSDTGNYWYRDNVLIPGENNQTLTANVSGDYTVQVMVDQCSSQYSDAVLVNVTSVEAFFDGDEVVSVADVVALKLLAALGTGPRAGMDRPR